MIRDFPERRYLNDKSLIALHNKSFGRMHCGQGGSRETATAYWAQAVPWSPTACEALTSPGCRDAVVSGTILAVDAADHGQAVVRPRSGEPPEIARQRSRRGPRRGRRAAIRRLPSDVPRVRLAKLGRQDVDPCRSDRDPPRVPPASSPTLGTRSPSHAVIATSLAMRSSTSVRSSAVPPAASSALSIAAVFRARVARSPRVASRSACFRSSVVIEAFERSRTGSGPCPLRRRQRRTPDRRDGRVCARLPASDDASNRTSPRPN